jgi:phospholipase C
MQENRSFDHCFGTLHGVRGFNDPRAIQLPNGNPVWLQSNNAGDTFAPFHLDIKDTKATWMSSLPHSWKNQVGARNDGKYDQWLNEKRNSIKEYAEMPLTMGYYDRRDIPFYYALADGFTVCDQHFCSALTGTNPNRLYFWTGTIREEQNENSRAHVWNEDMDYETLHWKTYPEVLEDNDISWKFYQNELSIDVGFKDEQDAWLSNFQDNPLEFFSGYNIRLHGKHLLHLHNLINSLPVEIDVLKKQLENLQTSDPSTEDIRKKLKEKQKALDAAILELKDHNPEKFDELSAREKSLHRKAFSTNINDPHYHTLDELVYDDNGVKRGLQLPKGDLLHQFREDVTSGKLPMVSWLAAPENLSDHPSSAWYGAWYVSEVMDILTKNPEVWKKTIFILTYDENDGYFDHVPHFVAPHSGRMETGKVSEGMDTRVDYVTLEQEKERNGFPVVNDRESPIGLGFRVPLIVASPWSRGGFVNSEVFDLTSTIQFLEVFLNQKTGKSVKNTNISDWRRTVAGDLTSIFRPSAGDNSPGLEFLKKDAFMESVYNAKFKKLPNNFTALSHQQIIEFNQDAYASPYMPKQEKGIKPSNGLFYQLYADGALNADKTSFDIDFKSSDQVFGEKALGSPFNVYAPGKYIQNEKEPSRFEEMRTWAFAVKSGDQISAHWPLKNFANSKYHVRIYGPNGFFREYMGSAQDPLVSISCEYQKTTHQKLTGNIDLLFRNQSDNDFQIEIIDHAYGNPPVKKMLVSSAKSPGEIVIPVNLSKQFGWYDFSIKITGNDIFEKRYAGRVETGESGFSDPFMGRMI